MQANFKNTAHRSILPSFGAAPELIHNCEKYEGSNHVGRRAK